MKKILALLIGSALWILWSGLTGAGLPISPLPPHRPPADFHASVSKPPASRVQETPSFLVFLEERWRAERSLRTSA